MAFSVGMKEAGVVVDVNNEPIYWHDPAGRSAGALPDSRDLWDVLWEHRARVLGFAHTHPGGGRPVPSFTDVTTFAAVESALSIRLVWWISTSDMLATLHWRGPAPLDYVDIERPTYRCNVCGVADPKWLYELRRRSAA